MQHRIDLYRFSLDVPESARVALHRLLTPEECERAERLVFLEHREHFVVGRGRLRQVLAGYVARPSADLRFAYGPHGKPRLDLDCPAPPFNLSHTGNQAALAVSMSVEVGVDIETVRPIERGLARRFFAPAEIAALEALPPEGWLDGFFQCWTRKEAVLKAMGRGFSKSLASFDVSIADDLPPRVLRLAGDADASRHWSVFEARPKPQTIIAIAAAVERSSVGLVQFDLDACGRHIEVRRLPV